MTGSESIFGNCSRKALEDHNKAIELGLHLAANYNNRGMLYQDLGDIGKAIEDYTRAIEADPKYREAYQNRASAYAALGEKELARADRKSAAKL